MMSTCNRSWMAISVLLTTALAACPEPPDTPNPPRRDAAHYDAGSVDTLGTDSAVLDSAGQDLVAADSAAPDVTSADSASPDAGGPDAWEPSCEDECSEGSQVCDTAVDGYRICGQYDLDDCLELSPTVACAPAFSCTAGVCVPDCRDECPVSGTLCQDENTVLACGNFDTDACLDLGGAVACGTGKKCEAGQCVDTASTCSDECADGETTCFGDAVRTCGAFDSDSCRDFSMPVTCGQGLVCQGGACTSFCEDECSSAGVNECVGNGVRSCGNYDADGCLEWGPITGCQAPQFCTAGVCSVTCTHECDSVGQALCVTGGVAMCGEFDGDPCRDLSTPTPCPAGYACGSGGLCSATCTNDCALGTPPRCGTDGFSLETCGNFDGDVCSEWGGAITCPGGATCTGGSCDTPCTDDCTPSGLTECISGDNATQTCGQYDLDSCYEWAARSACEAWQVCSTDQCVLGVTPATILINEVLYDATGTDNAAGTLVFVELWGPASQSLDGYELVGVNGNGGVDYNRIALTGEVTGTDGYFVIAHPQAAASLLALADITKNEVDYQNGPDAIQLRWRGRLVDAVGYGVFGSGDVFAGEGTAAQAAPPSGAGKSLTRSASHADTDVNSADFSVALAPSPRANPPDCLDECPTLNATRCSSSQVQTCRADVDADSCLEWTAAANCPISGESCVGTTCQAPVCSDECPTLNATECVGLQIRTCRTDVDSDSCREWTAAGNCPVGGQTCNSLTDQCETPTCSNDCNPGTDLPQCGGTNGQQIRSCVVDGDPDSCYEWSTYSDCTTGGQVCIGGTCTTPCNHECPSTGATRCAINGQIETCGNYDTDACREWSAPANCGGSLTCIVDSCQAPSAPEVRLISPQGTVQTTQGNVHRILVDATAAPGRSIVRVDYYVDNVKKGETTAAPHEYFYTVPANAPTNSTQSVQAKAVDNQNVTGSSSYAYLDVKNDAPVAAFTAIITNINGGVGTVTADASAVRDTETSTANLEVCWDWMNSGTCSAFSTDKIAVKNDFAAPAPGPTTYTIRMVVRDAVGQTHATTRDVTFTSIQYIGGQTIDTTLWYGTVVITGDVTVGATATLTIAEGTQILFVRTDQDNNGIGDYTFDVAGTLIVEGTANNPVVFTGQDSGAKVPGAWDRIILRGSAPSTLTHTVVEYADVGIEARNGSILDHVTVRSTHDECIRLNNADNAVLSDVTVTECGSNGVSVYNGTTGASASNLSSTVNGANGLSLWQSSAITVVGATLANNTVNGARVGTGSTLNLSDADVEDNDGAGIAFLSSAGGAVTHNQIHRNGLEGIGLYADSSGNPAPVVNYNNIYSNGSSGTMRVQTINTSATLTASYSSWGSSVTSSTWSVPGGSTIRRAYINYDETDNSSNYVTGTLQEGGGSTIRTFTSDFAGWVYVDPSVTSLRVRVADSGYGSAVDTITASQVEVVWPDGSSEVVAIVDSGTVDLRYNYLGVFPGVLSHVELSRPDAVNLQGFVGSLYDSSWDRGIYLAGPITTRTLDGTFVVTGDITIAAGAVVSVEAGSIIQFVKHDQDGDGDGDFSITSSGQLNLTGAQGDEIVVDGYGAVAGNAFQTVLLAGSTGEASHWSHVTVSKGRQPVRITGNSALDHITVAGGSGDGVKAENSTGVSISDCVVSGAGGTGFLLNNADSAILSDLTSEANSGNGLTIQGGSTGVSVSKLLSRYNTGSGVYVLGGSTPSIVDSTIRENTAHGIHVDGSTPSIMYNLLAYNGGSGLRIDGSGTSTGQYNIVKFNENSGVSAWSKAGATPAVTVSHSNIYSNSTNGSSIIFAETPSSTLTASYSSWGSSVTSSTWTAADGRSIRRVFVSYDETDNSSNYVTGTLLTGGGSVIQNFSSDFNGWVYVPAGTMSLRVRVADSGYGSATDSITVTTAEMWEESGTSNYELVAVTDSGTVGADHNFWTSNVGDVPSKIFEARTGTVDYSGYTGSEYPSGSVTQVGPRP
ncbi:MAG: right-handed parallel beta-helix repeat-containing protein [Pseudomonadota bacterium]